MSGARLWLLILIFIIAAVVRSYALGRASFWYDEFGSLEASTGRGLVHLQLPLNQPIDHPANLTSLQDAPPLWKIWTTLDLDNHPPLYFIVLRIFRDCLGDSEWGVRLPSAICSMIALIFFYLMVRMQLRQPAALAATALMAVAGSQITLAQEARPYMLWLALSLGCGWQLLRIEKSGITIRRLLSLLLLAYASLITHYFAAIILLSLIIYALVFLSGKQCWTTVAAIACAIALFAATWGIFLLRQFRTVSLNNAWQYDPSSNHLASLIWHLIQLPTRWLSEPAADWPAIAILIAGWCVYAVYRNSRNATHCGKAFRIPPSHGTPGEGWGEGSSEFEIKSEIEKSPHPSPLPDYRERGQSIISGNQACSSMLFWLLWAVPLIAAISATDIARHARSLMFMRYTFAAGPALFFLAGSAIESWKRGWIVPALLGLLCIATIPDAYSKVMDWRNVAAMLKSNIHPGDSIIYTPGPNEPPWSQTTFLGISQYAPNLPGRIVILTDPKIAPNYFLTGHSTWVLCTDPNLPANALDSAAKIVRTGIAPSIGRVSELSP